MIPKLKYRHFTFLLLYIIINIEGGGKRGRVMNRNKWYCTKTKKMTLKEVKVLIERNGFKPHWVNIYNLETVDDLPYDCDFVKALDNLKVAFFQIENYEDENPKFDFLVIKFEPIVFINYTEV